MGLLADTFREHLSTFLEAHNPARVLVGGLPDILLSAIAKAWNSPFQLYLVSKLAVPALPRKVLQCGADDLTAVRQGAWAALVSPLESGHIQESIRSSGAGTVRELWQTGFPWQPCELPGARWNDLRDSFVSRIGLAAVAPAARGCIDQFRDELRGESAASQQFFGALESLPVSGVTYADLCFYLGFPSHAPGTTLRKRGDAGAVLHLLDEFVAKFSEEVVDDALTQVTDVARARYAGNAAKLTAVEDALKFFVDEFRHLPPSHIDMPVLAWRTIFRGNRTHWETLSSDTLSELIGSNEKGVTFGAVTLLSGSGVGLESLGENALIFRDRNVTTHAILAEFSFARNLINAARNAESSGNPWKLEARVNRVTSTLAATLPTTPGPHSYPVPLLVEGKQTIRFAARASSGAEQATSKQLTLWECCQDYPLIIASEHARVQARRRKRSKDEESNLYFSIEQVLGLPNQGRVVLYGFVYGAQGSLTAVIGDDDVPVVPSLSPIANSSCHRFTLTIDATDQLEVQLMWVGPAGIPHRGNLSFEFKGEPGPRDDALTDVLVRAHGIGIGKRLRDSLLKVKDSQQIPPSDLPIKESVKPIAAWEKRQQDVTKGWWPVLASLETGLREQRLRETSSGYFVTSDNLTLDAQANAWQTLIAPQHAFSAMPREIAAYVQQRTAIINALKQQFLFARPESSDEVNIARTPVVGLIDQQLVSDYVQAYLDVLLTARDSSYAAEWRCIGWCLDSILLFEPNAMAPTAQLLGPFHAITLARLFFVQHCLLERSLENDRCPLARAFVQAPPIASGHVVDAQLQPAPAIAFLTGEPHWLWLYRPQAQSGLPTESLLAWLRRAGLDPQIGPLGVDAEVLPDTLRQYLLAYPSRQTIRLSLEDCSQRTYEVLRAEAALDDAADAAPSRLRSRLPGGISVYDPITRLQAVDGEPIAHDPDLALRWHHSPHPPKLGMDVATLQPSHRVDFQLSSRTGAWSSAVPTIRRGLMRFGLYGLEHATALDSVSTGPDLPGRLARLLAAYEPAGQQLSWGTTLSTYAPPKANWTLCGAGQVDPRLFIDYVVAHPGTALWTYRLFGAGVANTLEFGRGHFLIARISEALGSGLNVLLAGIGLQVTKEQLLREIAEAGLTLGDEFLRTGRAAEGALGQYLVQRLLWRPGPRQVVLPHSTTGADGEIDSSGFLLQVDPFRRVLDALIEQEVESNQRSDLVSIQIRFCGDELWIKPVVFESKLIRTGQVDMTGALGQAMATAKRIDHLLEYCLHDPLGPREAWWSQPERILLADLLHLGLRIARGTFTGDAAIWDRFEKRVLSATLSGAFRRDDAQVVVVVHHGGATENALATAQPHVKIAFTDVNVTLGGGGSAAYQDIQRGLAQIVRHDCRGDSNRREQLAQGTSQQSESPAVQIKLPDSVAPVDALDELGQSPREQVVRDRQIAAAHAAFDEAFQDFIGNRQAIEKLRDDVVDALIKHPPHLPSAYLFTGNPSTGKTTLANKVASLLGVTFVKLVGTNVRNEADLIEQVDNAFRAAGKAVDVHAGGSQGLPEHDYPECLIFIDEIHLVKGKAQEGLLTLTEPKDRYVRLRDRICNFPRATYIAATTRDSDIDKALRTRFGNPIRLNDYKVEEVASMLRVKSPDWAVWPEEICLGLARLSRCVPREAERMAQKLERKLNVAREQLTLAEALEKLRLEEGLDRNGFDQTYWDALRLLAKQARPVGRETLAKQLGIVDEVKLTAEIIPNLQALALIDQVAGGQVITDRGRNYLRNEAPPGSP